MSTGTEMVSGSGMGLGLRRAWFVLVTVVLCLWVLLPIYLLFSNAFSTSTGVTAFPKSIIPPLSIESVGFFFNYHGVGKAFWSSVQVAVLTMLMSFSLNVIPGSARIKFCLPLIAIACWAIPLVPIDCMMALSSTSFRCPMR